MCAVDPQLCEGSLSSCAALAKSLRTPLTLHHYKYVCVCVCVFLPLTCGISNLFSGSFRFSFNIKKETHSSYLLFFFFCLLIFVRACFLDSFVFSCFFFHFPRFVSPFPLSIALVVRAHCAQPQEYKEQTCRGLERRFSSFPFLSLTVKGCCQLCMLCVCHHHCICPRVVGLCAVFHHVSCGPPPLPFSSTCGTAEEDPLIRVHGEGGDGGEREKRMLRHKVAGNNNTIRWKKKNGAAAAFSLDVGLCYPPSLLRGFAERTRPPPKKANISSSSFATLRVSFCACVFSIFTVCVFYPSMSLLIPPYKKKKVKIAVRIATCCTSFVFFSLLGTVFPLFPPPSFLGLSFFSLCVCVCALMTPPSGK